MSSEPFTLIAGSGSDEKAYLVHKDLLCWYSPYFKKALGGPFKEANEVSMSLAETEVEVVGIFVDWLYRQCLPAEEDPRIKAICEALGEPTEDTHSFWTNLLTGIYLFGDRYDVPELRKHAMDRFYHVYGDPGYTYLPEYDVVLKAFNSLPRTSGLCQFLIDIYARRWHKDCDEDEVRARAELPRDFLAGLMEEMADIIKALTDDGEDMAVMPVMPKRCKYET